MPDAPVERTLERLFPGGRGIFLAYDQGFEHGPTDFSGDNADPEFILKLAASGHYQGVILHRGPAEKYYPPHRDEVPLILKLNGKTSLHEGDPVSKAVATVEDAVSFGAAAVGYTVYVGSQHESEMLTEFGTIITAAHAAGLPVFGWMYPRGEAVKDPTSPGTIAYAARVGLEMGADVAKVFYPGSPEALKDVLTAAGRERVAVAGGVKQEAEGFTDQVRTIFEAGAAGIAVGRNVWQAADPATISAELERVRSEFASGGT